MKRFLILLLVAYPAALHADGGLPTQPYIYVEGSASISEPPDTVNISFSVVTHETDQPKANAKAQAKATKVLKLLHERQVADKDIVADTLQIDAEYDENENHSAKSRKINGYKASRDFEVNLRDMAGFPKLIDDVIALGDVQFERIEGKLTKEKELAEQLSDKVVADAREKAEKSAGKLGMRVDSVFAMSPIAISEIMNKLTPVGERGKVIVTGSNVPALPESPQYLLRPVEVSQNVYVIFLISPQK